MLQVSQKLPALNAESEALPFPAGSIQWNKTLQTSQDEINRFREDGFTMNPPLTYGPWLSQVMQDIEQACNKPVEKWNIYEIKKAGRYILDQNFLMVYAPINYMQPKITNKKTFLPGYFDGWMILVDFKQGIPLGYARFQCATTLYKLEYRQFGIGIDPIPISLPLFKTTNVQKELEDDFRNEFFRKSDSTYMAFKQRD